MWASFEDHNRLTSLGREAGVSTVSLQTATGGRKLMVMMLPRCFHCSSQPFSSSFPVHLTLFLTLCHCLSHWLCDYRPVCLLGTRLMIIIILSANWLMAIRRPVQLVASHCRALQSLRCLVITISCCCCLDWKFCFVLLACLLNLPSFSPLTFFNNGHLAQQWTWWRLLTGTRCY